MVFLKQSLYTSCKMSLLVAENLSCPSVIQWLWGGGELILAMLMTFKEGFEDLSQLCVGSFVSSQMHTEKLLPCFFLCGSGLNTANWTDSS